MSKPTLPDLIESIILAGQEMQHLRNLNVFIGEEWRHEVLSLEASLWDTIDEWKDDIRMVEGYDVI